MGYIKVNALIYCINLYYKMVTDISANEYSHVHIVSSDKSNIDTSNLYDTYVDSLMVRSFYDYIRMKNSHRYLNEFRR